MQKSAFTARCAADRNFTPGVTLIRGGVHICTAVKAEELSLLLYRKGEETAVKIDFPKEGKTGGLWTMDLLGSGFQDWEYTLSADGTEITDPYGCSMTGRGVWGTAADGALRCHFPAKHGGHTPDKGPGLSLEDALIYRIHVRGFSMMGSTRPENKGTFRAIREKIPYIKKLGMTAVELMPAYEFEVVMRTEAPEGA